MRTRTFPVLWSAVTREKRAVWEHLRCPKEVPWWMLAPHEKQALRNHGGQTLERLAERGGLAPNEMVAVMEDRRFDDPYLTCEEAIPRLLQLIFRELP